MDNYTSLGVAPAFARRSAEKRDPLLARTGPAARAVLKRINALPREQRVPELNRVLADLDPAAPARLHRVTERLHAEGMSVAHAVERALTLTLADASVEHFKALGLQRRTGNFRPVGSLGDPMTSLGDEAGDAVAGMIQGITCTPAMRDMIAGMVGASEGREAHDATQVGFDTARAMSMCPDAAPPVEPPLPPAEPGGPSILVPVLVGVGALVLAGGVVWYAGKKR